MNDLNILDYSSLLGEVRAKIWPSFPPMISTFGRTIDLIFRLTKKYIIIFVYSWRRTRIHLQIGSGYFHGLTRAFRKRAERVYAIMISWWHFLAFLPDFGTNQTWKRSWSAVQLFTISLSKRGTRKARWVLRIMWARTQTQKFSHSVCWDLLRTASKKLRFVDKPLLERRIERIIKLLPVYWRTGTAKGSETESLMNLQQIASATVELLGLLNNITCEVRSWVLRKYLFLLQNLAKTQLFQWVSIKSTIFIVIVESNANPF